MNTGTGSGTAVEGQVVRGPLTQSIPLRNPAAAFGLTFIFGPFGLFYVSWRFGVMSLVAFAAAACVDVALTMTTHAGWPVRVPIIEIRASFAPFLSLLSWALALAVLGLFCAHCARERNKAVLSGDRRFRNARHSLKSVAFIYFWFLLVPWLLHDVAVGVMSLIKAEFITGIVHLCLLPHVIIAVTVYSVLIGILWVLLPGSLPVAMSARLE